MTKQSIKKYILIITLTALIFLLSGCVLFDVELGIDPYNTAYLSYHLEMDIKDYNVHQQHNFKQALYQIAIHYHENLGFSVVLNTEVNPIVLTAEKKVQNNSFEEAFESLKLMLTEEDMTIFMMVDMAQVSYPRQSGYIINATVDIPGIIESSDFDNLPPDFKQNFEDAIRYSEGTISLSLPADALVSASHAAQIKNDLAQMNVPISFTGQTDFDLSAIRNLQGSSINVFDKFDLGAFVALQLTLMFENPDDSFIDEQIRLRSITGMIMFAAIVLIILTCAISIIVLIVQRRRYNE